MARIITFNATSIGASHIKSGKPCQDYSLSWQSEDGSVSMTVVCDGHGGSTYVRSDVGSRCAAEIARDNILAFIADNDRMTQLFVGREAAVTARPVDEKAAAAHQAQASLGDSQRQLADQDEAFRKAVADIPEQDYALTDLFGHIYVQWLNAVQDDMREHPFTDAEMEKLGNKSFVKAYGCTLIAYVRTPDYWLAFHIGDGKLLACDEKMVWTEPVPWDCRCFLNLTTSLCESNPIPSFRYAFGGKGEFPIAIFMGSDGIDDSWGTFDLLANFYSQTLQIFDTEGSEQTIADLRAYLPKLSEKGSRDDMSVAAIIDMDAIHEALPIYEKRRELKALEQEHSAKEEKLHQQEEEEKGCRNRLDKAKEQVEAAHRLVERDTQAVARAEENLKQSQEKLQQSETQLQQAEQAQAEAEQALTSATEQTHEATSLFDEWTKTFNAQCAEIMQAIEKLCAVIKSKL